jgi:hypothetical protein
MTNTFLLVGTSLVKVNEMSWLPATAVVGNQTILHCFQFPLSRVKILNNEIWLATFIFCETLNQKSNMHILSRQQM